MDIKEKKVMVFPRLGSSDCPPINRDPVRLVRCPFELGERLRVSSALEAVVIQIEPTSAGWLVRLKEENGIWSAFFAPQLEKLRDRYAKLQRIDKT